MTKALFNMTSSITTVRVGDRVDGRDGPLGTVAGTRAATAGHPAYVLVRLAHLLGLAHTTHLVPAAWVRHAPSGAHRVTLDAGRAGVAGCLPLRADEAVRADVVHALATAAHWFRAAAIRVAVRDGVVDLTGHAPSAWDTRHAAARARAVRGVLGVRDHAVDDDALVSAVAQALTQDPAARAARLQVASRLGEVELSGALPSEAARRDATALAREVRGVTRVHNGATIPSAPDLGAGRQAPSGSMSTTTPPTPAQVVGAPDAFHAYCLPCAEAGRLTPATTTLRRGGGDAALCAVCFATHSADREDLERWEDEGGSGSAADARRREADQAAYEASG